ncbi:hypothetical protein ELE36_02320 [Pseudolysobacter antarcticus]|uniref:Uncharacterized protein n=1 Tax=Pseudolysobacter antarcticus TaxID=2511995 RepID=A0A411HFN9_9GAMM|nr:hypothetical protein [Pseudolysobacter antarcticus]QBB69302.1 hypothetical protein ELE36_02320 [Pseudolysobacter antarcticus]
MMPLYSVSEEVYPHEYLWRAATKVLEEGEMKEHPSFHFLLPALLTSYMAYEAFINFCGELLLPQIWSEERKHFKGVGIEGKVDAIVKKLSPFTWHKGKNPYQQIRSLENFRDMVAHGKVQSVRYVTDEREGRPHIQFKHAWDTYLTGNGVREARAAICSFCEDLLVEARKSSHHPHLLAPAFKGVLASAACVENAG